YFFQAEDGIRDDLVTGVQTCALPISVDLLLQRVERQPAREGDARLLQLPASLLPGGEPLKEKMQAHLPLLLLLLDPLVKAGFLAQPEAVKEGTAHQREGLLHLGDQGGPLLLRGDS